MKLPLFINSKTRPLMSGCIIIIEVNISTNRDAIIRKVSGIKASTTDKLSATNANIQTSCFNVTRLEESANDATIGCKKTAKIFANASTSPISRLSKSLDNKNTDAIPPVLQKAIQ